MFRFFILFGFTLFIFRLHVSGDINNYINMKYSYLSFSAMIMLGFLTVVQFIHMWRTEKAKMAAAAASGEEGRQAVIPPDHVCSDDCNHKQENSSLLRKLIIYPLFIIPVLSGIFIPPATLNSKMVDAKGFHIPALNDGSTDPNYPQQFLRPDSSIFYTKDDYEKKINKEVKPYLKQNHIVLDDNKYMRGMELLYHFTDRFVGKTVELDGFIYNQDDINKEYKFVFRFGIIHCIADSGVFGLLAHMNSQESLPNDQWVHITGTLSTMYYPPFKSSIPYIQVKTLSKIDAPASKYVYRQ